MTRATSSSSLSEQAAHEIMDMILVEQRFRVGDKLPNELELAEELGISRVTLREAIRILCTRGLVEIRRGRGTYVVSGDASAAVPDEAAPFAAPDATIRDLLEIRLMVEPMAAYYAAKRASDQEIGHIDSHRQRIEELAAEGKNVLKEEQDFHNAISMASHNHLMERLLPIINKSIIADVLFFKESIDYSIQDHREIVRCIRAHSAEAARTTMRLHIIHCYQITGQEVE